MHVKKELDMDRGVKAKVVPSVPFYGGKLAGPLVVTRLPKGRKAGAEKEHGEKKS